ncbi:MAG: radical SAM family heme chaperone HemW [Pseudomonadota bacterium]
MTSLLRLPPLSLYIHIPWCIKKCPYCDFNSHEHAHIPEAEYVQRLRQDIEQELPGVANRKLSSIFFGGGTPSLFSANAIDDILSFCEKTIGFAQRIEITLEANPGSFEQQKFKDYHRAGVNRLSVGVQSFQPQFLQTLGRIHNTREAINAIASAQKAGFDNINIDLMHGLPDQTPELACKDLQTAIELGPQHISWYQLTIEPNTVFYRQAPSLPADDTLADIQTAGQSLLAQQGFTQYEVSAYASSQQGSKHNINYWEFADYIGIGAGAHGKITDITSQTIIRRQKTRLPKDYLSSTSELIPNYKQWIIDQDQLALEFMMNALRLMDGVPAEYFQQRTGLSLRSIDQTLQQLVDRQLIIEYQQQLKTTELGQRFLNDVITAFSV